MIVFILLYTVRFLVQYLSAVFWKVLLGIFIMAVLKLEKDNESQEIEFELDYLASLTTRQRFQMMQQKSLEMALLLRRNGRRKSTQVIKRT